MAKPPRYLWGETKMDKARVMKYIDLEPQSSPPSGKEGRIYLDTVGMVNVCIDGTSWGSVYKLTPRTNPPGPYKGRIYMDPSYKLRISEDGSTFTTVTTS